MMLDYIYININIYLPLKLILTYTYVHTYVLMSIRLWDNKIEDEGALEIAKALRVNTVLEALE